MHLVHDFDFPNEAITSAILILTWLMVIRSARSCGIWLAIISLPGTLMHELLHWLVGLLLYAKPRSFSIFPVRQGNRWRLGSVGFSNLNIMNAAPVAFAPLLLLGIAGAIYQCWMLPTFQIGNYLIWVAAGYLTACSLFSCVPSAADLEVGAMSGLMYGCIGFGVWKILY